MLSLEQYVKKDKEKIKGWLTWIDAEIIRTLLSSNNETLTPRLALEIGVHRGKSAILFLLSPSIQKLVAVDLFENQLANVDKSGSGRLNEFLENIKKFQIDSSKVEIISTDSTLLTPEEIQAKYQFFNIIHIDGGHTKMVVLHDLNLSGQILSSSGVIIVDDFLRPDWPEVGQAVYEWLSLNTTFKIFCIGSNKVFICKENFRTSWQDQVFGNHDLQYFWRKESFIDGFKVPSYYHHITTEWGVKKKIYEYVRLFHPNVFIFYKKLTKSSLKT
ncbi:MAG: class I SAM-dependent methyltransferase [Bacteroidetes bacterium]|nr:class I SAM-dependent methyltransferase [Bacteroidota bacterium]